MISIDTPYQATPTLQLGVFFLWTQWHPIGNTFMKNTTKVSIGRTVEIRITSWCLIGPYEGLALGKINSSSA